MPQPCVPDKPLFRPDLLGLRPQFMQQAIELTDNWLRLRALARELEHAAGREVCATVVRNEAGATQPGFLFSSGAKIW